MARGLPALWSALLGAPFVVGGAHVFFNDPNPTVPAETGLPILAFGLFVATLGLYIHYVASPDTPTMGDGEEILDTRQPVNRAAVAKTVIGSCALLVAAYYLFLTPKPYVYPTVPFVVGLYMFSTGLFTYWTNTLTTYYVTDRRLIKEYRFISLVRQELPFEKVRGVEQRKSIWEALVGLGNVRVASGGGGALEIVVTNIYRSNAFASEIRERL
ncbi:PH domain-containing protein [Halorientalis sp.]|uniref:PH domain-containing protein n=1 Tax=Halorientalis sp. TaxID=1931229 RepID=UPI002604B499|nr:PH domain-containing protein [Halorientalis sp.]